MPLSPGTKLGPYEVESPLGAGGMGEVYRARDTRLDRSVAIKTVPANLSASADLKARFEREARAVSSLNHPNICHLYDVGVQDGTAFLVMEYLEGQTLDDRLRKGPLPLKQALTIAIQIAEALATAHRAGILHRDLKPGNIMLTAIGAKLLDFGLAKTLPGVAAGPDAAMNRLTPSSGTVTIADLTSPAQPLTKHGVVVGTFQYMAPEVLQGGEADARTDIFSFGCVLYEMITGHRAFEGKSQLSVMTAILEKDPEPPSSLAPASPPALNYLITTCLAKNPDERFQAVRDVKLQLQWIAQSGAAEPEKSTVSAKRSLLAWSLLALAIAVAAVSSIAYFRIVFRPVPIVRSSILPPTGNSFMTSVPTSGPAVISHDGTRIAFTARDEKGKVLLYVRSLSSTTALPLAGTDDAMYPFWSGDNHDLGFFSQDKLKRISADGGPVQVLCDAPNGRGGTWNRDGVILFAPSPQNPLARIPATGGSPEPATKLDASRTENSHRFPYFLPDGQHFLFWARSASAQDQGLYVGTLGSLQATQVLKGVTTGIYASGYLLYMRDQTLLARPFDRNTFQLSGTAMPVAERVLVNGVTVVPEFSASDNGTLVYHTGDVSGAWDLLWYDRQGKAIGAVSQQERYYYPALSPDGTRVAVALFNGVQGWADIWILDLIRGTKSRLTFSSGAQIYPVWSRDGKTIYYGSNLKSANHIYAKAADGSGSEQSILEIPGDMDVPQCVSPDGRYLIFGRVPWNDPHNYWEIWALALTGDRKPFLIVKGPFANSNPSISPNGRWLAYHSDESGRNEVYLTAFPNGGPRWQVSANGGFMARWRGDGKELFFLDPGDKIMAVDVDPTGATPKLGVPHVLFQAIGIQRQVGSYVVAPDGKRFLINNGDSKEGNEPLNLVLHWTEQLKK